MLPLLAIDKNTAVSMRESATWDKYGVENIRVSSMQEAIEKLNKTNYLFIAINADNINYLPHLRILRGMTPIPIFIICSTYTTDKEVEALRNGADLFVEWRDTPEDNAKSALAVLHRYTERTKEHKKAVKILSHGDILIVVDFHKAFVKDKELPLTKTELQILYYLMLNQGRVITHEQIQKKIWPNESSVSSENLYAYMKRLRKKIRAVANDSYIETVRDVGYRLSTTIKVT